MRHTIPHLTCLVLAVAMVGCTRSATQTSAPLEGWTPLGSVTVKAEQDGSVLRAESLPGRYKSLCVETNGPVIIERLGVSFADSTTFQVKERLSFDGPGRQVIEMPGGERRIMNAVMMHSGGRAVLGTKITLWVR